MKSVLRDQKEKLSPILGILNSKLSKVSLDNIRIIHENSILLDLLSQQKEQLDHMKQESTHSEADHEEIIGGLKSKLNQAERELKKE